MIGREGRVQLKVVGKPVGRRFGGEGSQGPLKTTLLRRKGKKARSTTKQAFVGHFRRVLFAIHVFPNTRKKKDRERT